MDVGNAVRVRRGFRLGHQGGAFDIGGQNGVQQRNLVPGDFLAHPANTPALRQVNHAVIKVQVPADQFEQGGFACTIAPDKAHFMSSRDRCGRILK